MLKNRRERHQRQLEYDHLAITEAARDRQERALEAEELAREYELSTHEVLRAFQAFDAIDRTVDRVIKCDGGLIESLPTHSIVRIGESRPSQRIRSRPRVRV